jgi:hypothetical protein
MDTRTIGAIEMKRCDKPATTYSQLNGFTVCDDHYVPNPDVPVATWHEESPCDMPIETREEFWRRHPKSRMYRKLFTSGVSTQHLTA